MEKWHMTELIIPEPNEVFSVEVKGGTEIIVRRYFNSCRPCLLLSHGNGFAIDAYSPFWGQLRSEFELCVYDQRHHGHNQPSSSNDADFDLFADDLDKIISKVRQIITDVSIYGVYHSLSAVASLLHAKNYKNHLDALVLFDPPLQPPKDHKLYSIAHNFEMKLSDWAKNRQSQFTSPAELAHQFRKSRSLSGWVDGAHELMAKSVLKETGSNWELICPPDIESQIYRHNASLILWDFFENQTVPIALIIADPSHPAEQAPAKVCSSLVKKSSIPFITISGTTHLLQIEKPEEFRVALKKLLREITL